MTKLNIKTTHQVVPMIYAYTTPEIDRHDGWTKIGYTEQDVDKRLEETVTNAGAAELPAGVSVKVFRRGDSNAVGTIVTPETIAIGGSLTVTKIIIILL